MSSRESFFSPKSSNGLFWKIKYIQGTNNRFFSVDFPIGGGECANNFVPEIVKYCHLKSRGQVQTAHAVCMLCWSLVPKDCFFPLIGGDSGNAKTGRIAVVDTETSTFSVQIKNKSNFLLFWFPGIWTTRVAHDPKPYMKLFSFCWLYDLERDQFAPLHGL